MARSVEENYCKDEYVNSLSASHNFKRCENIDESNTGTEQTVHSKNGADDDQILTSDKDDKSSIEKVKFAEAKIENAETENATSDADVSIRNEKFVDELKNIFEEVAQKYT